MRRQRPGPQRPSRGGGAPQLISESLRSFCPISESPRSAPAKPGCKLAAPPRHGGTDPGLARAEIGGLGRCLGAAMSRQRRCRCASRAPLPRRSRWPGRRRGPEPPRRLCAAPVAVARRPGPRRSSPGVVRVLRHPPARFRAHLKPRPQCAAESQTKTRIGPGRHGKGPVPCADGARGTTGRFRVARTPAVISPAQPCLIRSREARARHWQGWLGRGVARIAGRQDVATPAGSRAAEKMTGSFFESQNRRSHHNIGLDPPPSR